MNYIEYTPGEMRGFEEAADPFLDTTLRARSEEREAEIIKPESEFAMQWLRNLDDRVSNPTDADKYDDLIDLVGSYVTQRIQLERYRASDLPSNVFVPAEDENDKSPNERYEENSIDRHNKYYHRSVTGRHEITDKKMSWQVQDRANILLESLVTYLGSNEAWFGIDSVIAETSRKDKTDDYDNKVDAALVINVNDRQPIVFGIDFTTGGEKTTRKKMKHATDRALAADELALKEPIVFGGSENGFKIFSYIPIVLRLDQTAARNLIEDVRQEILEKGLIDQDGEAIIGITGTEQSIERRKPFIQLFISQIIEQLKKYDLQLSKICTNSTILTERLEAIRQAQRYFNSQLSNLKTDMTKPLIINDVLLSLIRQKS